MAYGKAVACGSGVGCLIAAACNWAAAAALYTPLAASAVARPRCRATPRNAAADTGDITKTKWHPYTAHCYSQTIWSKGDYKSYVENSHLQNAFLK